jgi:hypothetical protein
VHRLVIALTTLLSLVGVTVVAGYLLVFSASTDRAAAAVPADAPVYLNVYLQPSAAQQMRLGKLLGRLPGFGDQATLDTKVDEALQQALGGFGLDYRDDLKPWLGDQLAVAAWPTTDAAATDALLVAAVKERPAAEAALARLAGAPPDASPASYGGRTIVVGTRYTYAFLADDLVALGSNEAQVRRAIDVESGSRPALASAPAFKAAGIGLPVDYLASVYVDLELLGRGSGVQGDLGAFSTVSAVLVANDTGLELQGEAPFDGLAADASARAAAALTSEPASLSDWMPASTQAEGVVFGVKSLFQTVERLGADPGAEALGQALTQLRAVVAFGLGLSVDDDLLPLLDREAALAISVRDGQPYGQLLLRPADAAAAESALSRARDALEARGARVTTGRSGEVTVTTVQMPQVGTTSYAVSDGVVILGLSRDDVEAALTAHASNRTLAAAADYRSAFAALGAHGGHELYLDVPGLLAAMGGSLNLSAETRDILQHVGAVGLTVPARDDRIEFHAIVTIR